MSVLNRRALTGSTLVVLAVLFIALVMLTGVLFRGARVDLTQDRLYTLSEGTRALIGKMEGDEVALEAPGGTHEFEILEVRYE